VFVKTVSKDIIWAKFSLILKIDYFLSLWLELEFGGAVCVCFLILVSSIEVFIALLCCSLLLSDILMLVGG
jgi:hypothetical protein